MRISAWRFLALGIGVAFIGILLTVVASRDIGLRLMVPAQRGSETPELAAGMFLVASRDLRDPNFAQTVVLLTHYGPRGAMGLIVNRQTDVAVSRALKQVPAARNRSDMVFFGGPVERAGIMGLVRAASNQYEAHHVTADVYLLSTSGHIEKCLEANPPVMRVYAGHSGWAPGQLEREMRVGGWLLFNAQPATVFDANPDTVWRRLIRRTEVEVARAPAFRLEP